MRLFKAAALAATLSVLAPPAILLQEARAADQPTTPPPSNSDTYRQLDLFGEVFERVRSDYVENVTDEQLIEAAINGMLTALDPHSSYMNAKSFRDMQVQVRGEFGGLGIEVTMENGLVKVVSPIDDTPAAHAGLKPGDFITQIDSEPVLGMTLNDAVEHMRGPVGSDIKLGIRREGRDPFDVTMKRAVVKIQSVKSQLQGDVGYIRITSFNEQADSGVKNAVKELKAKAGGKLVGLVLDLRNNPGGLLDQAVAVSNDFLAQGEIVSTRGRHSEDAQRYNAQAPGDLTNGLPMVVLINGGSASASEIVAGALHDDHRAVLLGTRSFGKGSVQTVLPVKESAGAIRLTTALYYTPSGVSIQAKGIDPDVTVEPAKIEKVAVSPQQHEADLRGALKNDQAAAQKAGGAAPAPGASPAAATSPTKVEPANPPPNVPPGTTPVTNPGANALDSSTIGTDSDYQFVRAIDLLRGVTLFNRLAAH